MPSEGIALQSKAVAVPGDDLTTAESASKSGNTGGGGRPHAKSLNSGPNGNANFPPPKTDKPRPHVCGTCGRSFARLEHLKRHERSHTKEKPFECPECTRCFARRDLLLRHQQKLHMTTTPSSRPRNGRRESTSSTTATAAGRVRKNSTVNAGGAAGNTMRPRANTISVDNATLGMLAATNSSASRHGGVNLGHGLHGNLRRLGGPGGYELRGMSTAVGHHGNHLGLPKLETQGLNIDIAGGLRTAPLAGDFNTDFNMDNMLFGQGTTINPAQLHFTDSPHSLAFDTPASPFHPAYSAMQPGQAMVDEDGNFEWMHGFDQHMLFDHHNEHAISGSSPSAISTGSPSGISEVMLDGSNNPAQNSAIWQSSMSQAQMIPTSMMDLSANVFPELLAPGALSPKTQSANADPYFPNATPLSSQINGLHEQFYHPPIASYVDTPSNSAASVSSSNRQSSVTSVSTDSITEATRQALLTSLSQPSLYGHNHRKYSQPTISSPLSPGFATRPRSASSVSLPSTYDLQRYVAAYIQYFHPHLPFLHIPTLSFDSPVYTSNIRPTSGNTGFHHASIVGGGGCLILAMAAIGALYEYDTAASKELFEMAKRMIKLYLEERRKVDLSAAVNGPNVGGDTPSHNTPLWLVQAMLLNVIYGHNCGDKTSADIASTHCAALISLARAAELTGPVLSGLSSQPGFMQHIPVPTDEDVRMNDDGWNVQGMSENSEWLAWKTGEERKRTLYAVFILSSMLVSAYNHAPALTNSEIRLDLPCDEELWSADSALAWYSLGGKAMADQRATPFASALSSLLTASQRHQQQHQMPQVYGQYPGSRMTGMEHTVDFQPSTFGCLVLINALHNYIWETRQRHLGRQWTTQETESMHAHIEPALAAWQAAWSSNPQHSLERPNPYGFGPLSADSIPLLDLAYVRLFVNLGRSKEAFWQRDFDGMANELARGTEIIQHAEHSPNSNSTSTDPSSDNPSLQGGSPVMDPQSITVGQAMPSSGGFFGQPSGQTSKRERHLRKAAFHAAHSLSLSDKLGVTFADFNSRELPIQSALCAFDCAQVLAEWVSTVQERVGRYLGILGKDDIDFGQVPGIMLLEDEDCKLLEKIEQILSSAEIKMGVEANSMGGMAQMLSTALSALQNCGYGSKILLITAHMLDKAAVWPGKLPRELLYVNQVLTSTVTRLMARSLETQAAHIDERAAKSVIKQEPSLS
ncbi:MAG: hypothetical protein MMC33_004789 [Icmadophila ericetorum]|nr:hypothetical protein [Icmadophila ericetorum]